MKLTIEHLSAYLPWGLELLIEKDIVIEPTMFFDELDTIESGIVNLAGINHGTSYLDNCVLYKREEADGYVQLENVKPILRPLSDLAKEIEINGEKFVPIEQLLRIKYPNQYKTGRYSEIETAKDGHPRACFYYSANQDIMINTHYLGEVPYWIIQKLLSWNFDIFGLIKQGLAIDKNTLNQ